MINLKYSIFLIALCGWIYESDAALAAMSIDFGSQFIKIGLVKPGVPMEIVLNKESRRKTPNVMSIRNNERLFAEAAAAMAVKYPKSSYQFLFDLLAKKEGSPAVELYQQRFPFATIGFDAERGTVTFPSESEEYNVETLLAMILWSCKQDTQAFAEQTVKDVVITVPAYFNQAERRALVAAAEIAGLNLLQLMNDGSAAALNYGVFRRKEITEQAQTMLIYDMGASKTTATVVEYLLEEDKQKKEKNPLVRTIGIGFDRTLGGLEMTVRLRKHLEEAFRKSKKTSTDIATNPRSMAKLFKEAERLKQVLSANTDHFAQVESLHEDIDFKVKVSRDEFESLIVDLESRILQPLKDALQMCDLTIEKIDQFVLMGAGSRVPKVQSILQAYLGTKEIGRFLNTDEAIALGAVYQAAHLSKSFRVLPFGVQELQMYPIQVTFLSRNDTTGEEKTVSKTIFGEGTHYPAPKKTIAFTSYKDDFTFSLEYGPLSLKQEQLSYFGSSNLADVRVEGLADAIIEKNTTEGTKYKGVKAQFAIDLSGIVTVTRAEAVLEIPPQIVEEKEEKKEEDARATGEEKKEEDEKIEEDKKEANTDAGNEESQKADGEQINETEKEEDVQSKLDEASKKNGDEAESDTNKEGNATADKEKIPIEKPLAKPKALIVKADLKISVEQKDILGMSSENTESSVQRLATFERAEKEKLEREAAMNALETQVYDLAVKIEDGEEFAEFCTQEEKDKIKEETSKLRTWLEDDVGMDTKTEEFVSNKKILDDASKQPQFRMKERRELPKVVEMLDQLFNHSQIFLVTAQNMTDPEDPVFSATELDVLQKLISETETWWKEKQDIYVKQSKNEDPGVTTAEMYLKMRDLDREVKYLLNKMKMFVPKKRPTEEAKEEGTEKKEDEETEEKGQEGEKEKETDTNETTKEQMEEEKVIIEETGGTDDLPDMKAAKDEKHDASEF